MNLPFSYLNALYRKDNANNIYVWSAEEYSYNQVLLYHGRLDGTIIKDIVNTHRKSADEITSRVRDKRKAGYKFLNEVKDDYSTPVEEQLLSFLRAYLPSDRTDASGDLLAMLAKSFDKVANPFKNVDYYLGQWKINGLRCFIRVEKQDSMFEPYKLKFQPREGGQWTSLDYLEQKLLNIFPIELLNELYANDWALDGEVYIPGLPVNEINSAVKNTLNPNNHKVQFWCYDIVIPDCSQSERNKIRINYFDKNTYVFYNKQLHLDNTEYFVNLPNTIVEDSTDAIKLRDSFIDSGFEGLILRDPNCEYQFGKRNSAMLKYKRSTDGKFQIIDIYPEGNKRSDLPLFKLRNDINDATFEVHLGGTFEQQRKYLEELKEQTIGKYMFVEFGERSGVNQVPFHVKLTKIL